MMFILTALICMAMTAQAQTVYVSTGSDAVAYHKNKSCSYLKNSSALLWHRYCHQEDYNCYQEDHHCYKEDHHCYKEDYNCKEEHSCS